jgi:hypothetical protein
MNRMFVLLGLTFCVLPKVCAASSWDLALGGGYTIAQTPTMTYAHSQETLWGSVGYRAFPHWSVGMEGGHLFGKDINSDSMEDLGGGAFFESRRNEHVSATYVGPYAEAHGSRGLFSIYARAGAGIAIAAEHFTQQDIDNFSGPTETLNLTQDFHQTDLGVAMAIGGNIRLLSWLSVGIGVRDLMLLRHEGVVTENSGSQVTVEERLRARHLLMPFGELIVHFGSDAPPKKLSQTPI